MVRVYDDFLKSIGRVIDVYAVDLETDYLQALDNLHDCNFFTDLKVLNDSSNSEFVNDYLSTQVFDDHRKEFFSLLLLSIKAHNSHANEESKIVLPLLFQQSRKYPGQYRRKEL